MGAYSDQIMIIGGLGFIGSHIVERLVQKKEGKLLIVDDKSSGVYDNIKDFYVGEITTEILDIDKIIYYPNIEKVYHLGMPSSYTMFDNNRTLYWKTIKDFINVLEYCRKWKSGLVYASTASMYYGNIPPFKETMNIYPKDLYSECSFQMERLATLYHSLYGVETIGMRVFNSYGCKEGHKKNNASIIYQLAMSLGSKESPIIYGDGTQSRDFIYVDDIIDAFLLAMDSKVQCDVLNVGTGESYTFNEIVDLINILLSTKIEPKYNKTPVLNYVEHSLADMSKTNKLLKFKSKVSIEQGVKHVIEECLYRSLFSKEESKEE